MVAARFVMYAAFFGTGCLHFLTREMPTFLIPLLRDELGYGMVQRGALLGAYFPGYILGQMPSALLAKKLGSRNLLSLCNLVTAACLLVTPAAALSVRALSVVTSVQGFVGAAMLPVCGMMKTDWIPASLPPASCAAPSL